MRPLVGLCDPRRLSEDLALSKRGERAQAGIDLRDAHEVLLDHAHRVELPVTDGPRNLGRAQQALSGVRLPMHDICGSSDVVD